MAVSIERPTTRAGILALCRKRRANITRLEALLQMPMPQQDRTHLQHRLRGERANLTSWEDYLAKGKGKR